MGPRDDDEPGQEEHTPLEEEHTREQVEERDGPEEVEGESTPGVGVEEHRQGVGVVVVEREPEQLLIKETVRHRRYTTSDKPNTYNLPYPAPAPPIDPP